MSDAYHLLEAYLNGEITEADFPAFNAWLREDPEHLRQWVLASFMSHELAEALAQEANTPEQPPVIDQAGAARQGVMDAEVLSLLEQIEAASHDAPLREIDAVRGKESTPSRLRSSESIELNAALRDLRWAAGKLARQWVVSKPAYLAYAALVALLCVALFVDWGGEDAGPIAEWPPPDTAPGVETPSPFVLPVATLTAEYDAAWALQPGGDQRPGTIRPGAPLGPNQRLTLTEGFAEITTNRGAKVLLEAPATIETTDSDNAIRLHRGKLVGKCETESSKGFTVHAPGMDVVDLGTEFGVDLPEGEVIAVVFSGQIKVVSPETQEKVLLDHGQMMRLKADQPERFFIEPRVGQQFNQLHLQFSKRKMELPGTGVGILEGQVDPNWQVVAFNGLEMDTPQSLVQNPLTHVHQIITDRPAQWITWNLDNAGDHPAGQAKGRVAFTFRTQINIPDSVDPAYARIAMRFAADNQLQAMYINGNRIVVEEESPIDLSRIEAPRFWMIDDHLVRGQNTIDFEVVNIQNSERFPTAGHVALFVDWQLIVN
ncbi:MAG: FecR domain-containing protein [Planctomycetota bacterium]